MSAADSLVSQANLNDDDTGEFLPVADQKPTPVVAMPRLTVVETLYYHAGGASDPVGVAASFDRPLTSGEQLYVRETVIKDMTRLDVGWAGGLTSPQGNDVAQVLVENKEKKDGAWLRVYFGAGRGADNILGMLIPPGESARFTPFSSSRVWLESPPGCVGVRVSITAVPN